MGSYLESTLGDVTAEAMAERMTRLRDRIETRHVDVAVIRRQGTTVDADGDITGAATTIATIAATVIRPTAEDVDIASEPGQHVNAVLLAPRTTPVQAGDLVDVLEETWTVADVAVTRFMSRVALTRSGTS